MSKNTVNMTDAEKVEAFNLIMKLLEGSEPGDYVAIIRVLNDDKETDPIYAVECCAEYTEWERMLIAGSNILEALKKASAYKKEMEPYCD